MAGLTIEQFELTLDTIYSLERFSDNFNYIEPHLFVDGGKINVYTAEETPANLGEMILEHENIAAHKTFSSKPNYIYVEESVATVSKVIITGIKPTVVV